MSVTSWPTPARAGWREALLVGVLVGWVYFLPHALFIHDTWPDYHIPFLGSGDERGYCARIRATGEEGFFAHSHSILEHKDVPAPPALLSVGVVALLAKAVSLPYEQVAVVLDFLAPLGIFLMLYYLLRLLTGRVRLSIVGAACVLLTSVFTLGLPNMLLVGGLELAVKLGLLETYRGFPVEEFIPNTTFPFARLINPQVNFFPFGAALIFLTLWAKKRRLWAAVGLGVSTGSLFYIAPFFWMYLFAGAGLFAIYLLVKKEFWAAGQLVLALSLAVLLAVPWLYSVYQFFIGSPAEGLTDPGRVGLHIMASEPFLAKREILPILLFLIGYPGKDRRYFFLACLLLGGLVCENQHLVTGRQFGLFKFIVYVNGPVVWIALFTLLARWGEVKKGLAPVRWIAAHPGTAAVVCLAALFANGVGTQLRFYRADVRRPLPAYEVSAERWRSYQAYHHDFEWIKAHGTPRDVVLASDEISTLIPCLTHLNVLVSQFTPVVVTMSDEELLERWLVKLRFFGIPPERIREYLDEHILTSTNTPTLWYIDLRWGRQKFLDEAAYEETLDRVAAEYAAFYEQQDLLEHLERYHITYVWLSRYEDEEFLLTQRGFDPGGWPFLELVHDSERTRIYRVRGYQEAATARNIRSSSSSPAGWMTTDDTDRPFR